MDGIRSSVTEFSLIIANGHPKKPQFAHQRVSMVNGFTHSIDLQRTAQVSRLQVYLTGCRSLDLLASPFFGIRVQYPARNFLDT